MADDDTITDDDMRLVVSGAGQTLMMYAISDAFDWQKHAAILRPITQNAEKLMGIIDAYNEEHKDTPNYGYPDKDNDDDDDGD